MNSFVLKLLHSSESDGQLWAVFDDLEEIDCLEELAKYSNENGLLEQELTHPERNGSVPILRLNGITAKSKQEISWVLQQLIAKTELADFLPLCEDFFSTNTDPIEILDIPLLVKIKADETQIPKIQSHSWRFHVRVYGYLVNEKTLLVLGHCIRTTPSLQDCPRTDAVYQKIKKMHKAIKKTTNLEAALKTNTKIKITI